MAWGPPPGWSGDLSAPGMQVPMNPPIFNPAVQLPVGFNPQARLPYPSPQQVIFIL